MHLARSFQILIKEIVDRIDSGKNCMVVCVGGTGTGKSISMVSLQYWLCTYMFGQEPSVKEMNDHWVFKAKTFLQKMDNPNLKKKQTWIWDEAGVDISHKSHATMQNRIIGWLVQTFRNQQQIVLFTVPTLTFIDASIRKLIHYQIETRTILKSENICIVKPLKLQYNLRQDKIYYHNLVAPSVDGSGLFDEVDVVGVPRPPKDIETKYEEMKWKFSHELTSKLTAMITNIEDKETMLKRPLSERQEKILDALEDGITSTEEIAKIIGVEPPTISTNFGYMRRKGVNIEKLLRKKDIKGD